MLNAELKRMTVHPHFVHHSAFIIHRYSFYAAIVIDTGTDHCPNSLRFPPQRAKNVACLPRSEGSNTRGIGLVVKFPMNLAFSGVPAFSSATTTNNWHIVAPNG